MDGWTGLLAGVLAAITAGGFAYFNSMRSHAREAKLMRVNAQLERLYGPMLSLAESSFAAWAGFGLEHRPNQAAFFSNEDPPTEEERDAWVLWVRNVFQPTNIRICELLVTQTHLLDDEFMPEPLIAFLSHTAGYSAVIASWEQGDFRVLTPSAGHPGDPFMEYVREKFLELKTK